MVCTAVESSPRCCNRPRAIATLSRCGIAFHQSVRIRGSPPNLRSQATQIHRLQPRVRRDAWVDRPFPHALQCGAHGAVGCPRLFEPALRRKSAPLISCSTCLSWSVSVSIRAAISVSWCSAFSSVLAASSGNNSHVAEFDNLRFAVPPFDVPPRILGGSGPAGSVRPILSRAHVGAPESFHGGVLRMLSWFVANPLLATCSCVGLRWRLSGDRWLDNRGAFRIFGEPITHLPPPQEYLRRSRSPVRPVPTENNV